MRNSREFFALVAQRRGDSEISYYSGLEGSGGGGLVDLFHVHIYQQSAIPKLWAWTTSSPITPQAESELQML